MPRQDQLIEEKALIFKTLNAANTEQVTKFVVENNPNYISGNKQQRLKIHSLTHSILIPAFQSQWSFTLCSKDKIIGAYLQIDVLDYLKISQVVGFQAVSQLINISQFESYFKKLEPTIKRGDFILTMFNVVNSKNNNSIQRKERALIYQGFYLVKLGGWKNILFSTDNPIPFLKINAQVVMESQQNTHQSRRYLMKLKMNELNLNMNPFQKIYARL